MRTEDELPDPPLNADPADADGEIENRSTDVSRPRRSRRRRIVIGFVFCLGAVFVALTAHLFVWPVQGVPAHADAIIVFSGEGDRLSVGLKLANTGVAPNLIISVDSAQLAARGGGCNAAISGVTVYCFVPSPFSTQGEARYAATLADKNHWRSLILVTSTPQDWRARLRMSRCYSGKIYVATSPLPAHEWPGAVLYEWGATLKALILQRSC